MSTVVPFSYTSIYLRLSVNFNWIFIYCKVLVSFLDSRLHWLVFSLFYAYFVQWTIKLPLPPPISLISSTQTTIFYTLTQSSFVSHTHIYKPCSLLLFAIKKHDSFHTVKHSLLYSTLQKRTKMSGE